MFELPWDLRGAAREPAPRPACSVPAFPGERKRKRKMQAKPRPNPSQPALDNPPPTV